MEGRRPTSGPTVPRGLGDSEQDPPPLPSGQGVSHLPCGRGQGGRPWTRGDAEIKSLASGHAESVCPLWAVDSGGAWANGPESGGAEVPGGLTGGPNSQDHQKGFSQVPQPTLLQMVTRGDRGLMYHQAMTSFVSSLWKTVG